MSRRGFISGLGIGTAGLATAALLHGVTLRPLPEPNYQPATPEEKERLQSDNRIVIAHRAGNTEDGIRNAAKAGFDYADADLIKSGEQIYNDHGDEFFGQMIDGQNFSIKPIAKALTYERSVQVAAEDGIGLFLEFKGDRGDFEKKDIEYIYAKAQERNVKLLISSRSIEIVRMAQEISGDKNSAIYNCYDEEAWDEFKKDGNITMVLTNPEGIKNYGAHLESRGTNVFVEGVNNAQEALLLTSNKFIRGFLNESQVLEAIFKH